VLLVDEQPRLGRRFVTAGLIALLGLASWLVVEQPDTRVRPGGPAPVPVAAPPLSAPDAAVPPAPAPAVLPPLPPVERAPAPRPAVPAGQSPETPSGPAPAAPVGEPGSLFISSMPWGQLFIDGRPAGTTPKSALPLDPGPHRVEIVRAGYHPFRVEIHVTSGQEVRLVNIVLEALHP
jgi:hypothetical protein